MIEYFWILKLFFEGFVLKVVGIKGFMLRFIKVGDIIIGFIKYIV